MGQYDAPYAQKVPRYFTETYNIECFIMSTENQ